MEPKLHTLPVNTLELTHGDTLAPRATISLNFNSSGYCFPVVFF